MCELCWSVLDIVFVVFIIIEIKCCFGCIGLEGISIKNVLKIVFGWKGFLDRNDSVCLRIC